MVTFKKFEEIPISLRLLIAKLMMFLQHHKYEIRTNSLKAPSLLILDTNALSYLVLGLLVTLRNFTLVTAAIWVLAGSSKY